VPSPTMLKQIDTACTAAGIQPDLHLSGHAHLYERYTRTVGGKQIPYVVAGVGGYYDLPGLKPAKTRPAAPVFPASGTDASGNPLRLEIYNDSTFGFLRITISPASITGEFVTVDTASGKTASGDSFTVDLKANTISTGLTAKSTAKKSATPSKAAPKAPAKKTKKPAARKK
jgi:hypothetical protein